MTHMSDYAKDITRFIHKYGEEETDNYGQIVIYTGMMYDENGDVVPWEASDEREADQGA